MAYTSTYADNELKRATGRVVVKKKRKAAEKARITVKTKSHKKAGGGIAERYQKGSDKESR